MSQQMAKPTNGQTDRQTDGQIDIHKQTNIQQDKQIDRHNNGQTDTHSLRDKDVQVEVKEMDFSLLPSQLKAEFTILNCQFLHKNTANFSKHPCKPEVDTTNSRFLIIFCSFRNFNKYYHWSLSSFYTRYGLLNTTRKPILHLYY